MLALAELSPAQAAPAIRVTPAAVTFGSGIMIGLSSPEVQVLIESVGTAPLKLSTLSLTGSNPGDFSNSVCGSPRLDPGASCTVFVAFRPQGTGTRTAYLNVPSDDPANPNVAIELDGIGIAAAPRIFVPNSSLNFGTEAVGTQGASIALTVRNAGTIALNITSVGTDGPEFAVVTPSDCGLTSLAAPISGLQPTECTLYLRFTPRAAGPRIGNLAISSSDPGTPIVNVGLNGSGAAPALTLSATSINFGSVVADGSVSTTRAVTVHNSGAADLTVMEPAVSGANAADFPASLTGFPCTTHPGGDCTIQVTFKPRGFGPRSAVLTVASDATGPPRSVALNGFGEFVASTSPPPVPPTNDHHFCAAAPPAPGRKPVCIVTANTCAGNRQPVTMTIPVTRAFGSTNPLSFGGSPPPVPPAPPPTTIPLAMASGALSGTSTLELMTFAQGPVGPSTVTVNGTLVGTFTPTVNAWAQQTLTFPTSVIRFPGLAAPGSDPMAINTVTIAPDTTGSGGCLSTAWARMKFLAMSPVILVHGNNSDGAFFVRQGIVTALNTLGISTDSTIAMIPAADTIANNAVKLQSSTRSIPAIVRSYGVDTIHIVAHSKGGLDVRSWLSTNAAGNAAATTAPFRVISVTTLSTPHLGSAGADLLLALGSASIGLAGLPVSSLMALGLSPADAASPDLSTSSAASFNPPLPLAVDYRMLGGGADGNGDMLILSLPVDEYASARREQTTLAMLWTTEMLAQGNPRHVDGLVTALYQFLANTSTVTVVAIPVGVPLLALIPLVPPELAMLLTINAIVPSPALFSPDDLLVTTRSAMGAPVPFTAPLPAFTADHASIASPAIGAAIIPFLVTSDTLRGGLK